MDGLHADEKNLRLGHFPGTDVNVDLVSGLSLYTGNSNYVHNVCSFTATG